MSFVINAFVIFLEQLSLGHINLITKSVIKFFRHYLSKVLIKLKIMYYFVHNFFFYKEFIH